MIKKQSALSYLSFPPRIIVRDKLQRESSSLTSSLSGLTGQSRIKVLDSPIKSGNDRKKLRRNDYNFTVFNSSEAGFSLVELMITIVVFLLVIAGASQVLTSLITQFKQQGKITETNIEGAIGLDMMRRDIESAGYGLPWVIPATVVYNEAGAEAVAFNDCSAAAPCNPPKAIVSGNNMTTYVSPNNIFNGSDYLAIKAANVATSAAAQRWTHLRTGNVKRTWGTTADDFVNTDRVIVISPGTGGADSQTLVVSAASAWWTSYTAGTAPLVGTASFAPTDTTETRVIYGIDPDTNLRMPFNRTDYYIWRDTTNPATDAVPDRCAFGTGILRKTVIAQLDGDRTPFPLLDCVADMQVGFGVDTTATTDGVTNCYVNNLADAITVDAANIRNRVREVRVYILAHEGQYDRDFTFTIATPLLPSSIRVGEPSASLPTGTGICSADTVLGRNFNFNDPNGDGNTSDAITNWQNYRWKVYTLVVKPNNLR